MNFRRKLCELQSRFEKKAVIGWLEERKAVAAATFPGRTIGHGRRDGMYSLCFSRKRDPLNKSNVINSWNVVRVRLSADEQCAQEERRISNNEKNWLE